MYFIFDWLAMYIIIFSNLFDGEMFSNSYTYRYFITAMSIVDNIIRDYDLNHCKDGDCWSITVIYNTHTILTLNSNMF